MSGHTSVLTIGELGRRAGVSPSAIRYYERVGVLPPPARSRGRRAYGLDTLARLKVISIAKRAGVSLADIRTLLDAQSPTLAWRQLALRRRARLDVEAASIERQRALLARLERCRCHDFAACARATEGC